MNGDRFAAEVTVIGFDGDDTLWHSEDAFARAQERLVDLLAAHATGAEVLARLQEIERRNRELFGYGVKGFTLCMIETAIEVSNGKVPVTDIELLLETGREMLARPVDLLPGVAETLRLLADGYRLALITKGDLLNQETQDRAFRARRPVRDRHDLEREDPRLLPPSPPPARDRARAVHDGRKQRSFRRVAGRRGPRLGSSGALPADVAARKRTLAASVLTPAEDPDADRRATRARFRHRQSPRRSLVGRWEVEGRGDPDSPRCLSRARLRGWPRRPQPHLSAKATGRRAPRRLPLRAVVQLNRDHAASRPRQAPWVSRVRISRPADQRLLVRICKSFTVPPGLCSRRDPKADRLKLKLDLHDVYNRGHDIDRALREVIEEAVRNEGDRRWRSSRGRDRAS